MRRQVSKAKEPHCFLLSCEFFHRIIYQDTRYLPINRMNALISITEINSLYDQRPIIEKQASYAFVHPFAEAFSGVLADIPIKFVSTTIFNVIFYFLAGLVCITQF